MFGSQSVASDTINSKSDEGGGCMEAFCCKCFNRVSCVNRARNTAPDGKSPAFILQFLFFFISRPPVLTQPRSRNLANLWACFLHQRRSMVSVPPLIVIKTRAACRRARCRGLRVVRAPGLSAARSCPQPQRLRFSIGAIAEPQQW